MIPSTPIAGDEITLFPVKYCHFKVPGTTAGAVGLTEGIHVNNDGTTVGFTVGTIDGAYEGRKDGFEVGTNEGVIEGVKDGSKDGVNEGVSDGTELSVTLGV